LSTQNMLLGSFFDIRIADCQHVDSRCGLSDGVNTIELNRAISNVDVCMMWQHVFGPNVDIMSYQQNAVFENVDKLFIWYSGCYRRSLAPNFP
jgi:hypothetical protein